MAMVCMDDMTKCITARGKNLSTLRYLLSRRRKITRPPQGRALINQQGNKPTPQCGHLETTQAVTLKSGSSMTLLQFLNLLGCGENCIRKFSCFGVRVGGML